MHTSWINPSEAYDQGLRDFVADVLRPGENAFVESLARFHPLVSRLGMVNSLAQTLVKLASPGVPDIYQGQEIWDFSLVDPDNRRPVDFGLRRRLMDDLKRRAEDGDGVAAARDLVAHWHDGRIKLHVVQTGLRLRAAYPHVFGTGDYVPLTSEGEKAEHVVAFARSADGAAVIAVVPRLVAKLTHDREFALPEAGDFAATRLALPAHLAGRYRNVLTGEELSGADGSLNIEDVFANFPVALLERID
jgi:(1->4)-alpha-D-glucan 1-alpha-D-glucosylmutase